MRSESPARSRGFGDELNPLPIIRPSDMKAVYTNGNGDDTELEVDAFGNPTRITDANGSVVTIDRNTDGETTRVVDGNGSITEYARDDRGRVLSAYRGRGLCVRALDAVRVRADDRQPDSADRRPGTGVRPHV